MPDEVGLVGITDAGVDSTRPRFASEADALEKARALARALAATAEFRAFEAAHERLRADQGAGTLLRRLQAAEQQVAMLQTWGGMATEALDDLARLRAEVADHPTLKTLFAAQDALLRLFKDAAGIITAEVGVDFGAACSPAGGCC
jgi:cell fate (sporulation/competence/biofilm development) regulator YlbF (YheA/YmcA/DUF963 family)